MPTTSSEGRPSKPESSFESEDCASFTVPEEVFEKALPWNYKSETEKAAPSDSISYESPKKKVEFEI